MGMRRHQAVTFGIAVLVTTLIQPAFATPPGSPDRSAMETRLRSYGGGVARDAEARALMMPKVKTEPAVEAIRENFEVVGHLPFKGGAPDADVFLFKHRGRKGKHAYVGTWAFPCNGRGVKIVKTKRPRFPKLVGRAAGLPGTSSEDMVVYRKGKRDILAVGIQPCDEGAVGGLALYNVTTPSEPRLLRFEPIAPFGVHELDVAVRPDGRVLALLAVNFAETDTYFGGFPTGGDFRIFDITRPRRPAEVSDWGVMADGNLAGFRPGQQIDTPFEGLGYFAAQFAHSVRATDDGMTAYVSYWDSGILKFDISDPANPVLVGRTAYSPDDDGDAHSMTPYEVGGERYILQNDEDLNPWSILTITTTATGPAGYQALDMFWLPTNFTGIGEAVTGTLFDAGAGCTTGAFAGAEGAVVLVDYTEPGFSDEEPACDLFDQVVLAAGADAAALVINWVSPLDPFTFPPPDPALIDEISGIAADLPVALTSGNDGMAEEIRNQPGGAPTTVTITPETPDWGSLRVFRESNPTDINDDGVPEFEQVGGFDGLPHVTGEDTLVPPGSWTIHNTEVLGDRAYSSWYTHGIVALDVSDPTAPVKVGQFRKPSFRKQTVFGEDGFPQTWGIVVDGAKGLIYASDMRSGLWIIRPTGPAAGD